LYYKNYSLFNILNYNKIQINELIIYLLLFKIVSQYSNLLAPIAVDAVTKVIDPKIENNVDLRDIRLVKKVGGTIDDTELCEGLILTQNAIKSAGGPTRVEKAKIALVQF